MAASSEEQVEATLQGFEQMRMNAGALEVAPLYWVTGQTERVAMLASQDVPEIYPDRDAPSPSGLMGFAEPLPPLPFGSLTTAEAEWRGLKQAAPISALLWRGHDDLLVITAYSWSGHLSHPIQVSDHPEWFGPLTEITTFAVARHEAYDLEAATESPPEERALLAFLSTTWVQMMTPTMVQRKTIDPKTGATAPSGAPMEPPLVTTIDLRPVRPAGRVESAPEESERRSYHHRFAVRAHWRHQAYGPGRSQRRFTWIPAFMKGPDGAPLLATQKVMVWRR